MLRIDEVLFLHWRPPAMLHQHLGTLDLPAFVLIPEQIAQRTLRLVPQFQRPSGSGFVVQRLPELRMPPLPGLTGGSLAIHPFANRPPRSAARTKLSSLIEEME